MPRPPLPEQRRIAEILDTVDEVIQKTEQVIAKLKMIKQGLLHDLLTRGIDENGRLRDPEKHPEQFKETFLGWIPLDYEVKALDDCAEILDHLRVPVNEDVRQLCQGTVPYYGANGLQGFIDKPLFDEPLILLAEDGGNFDDYANRPIAYRIEGPSWVNNHAHILRPKPGIVFAYLFFSLVHRDIRYYIAGGTRTKLTQKELRSVQLAVASLPEQSRIADVLDAHDARIQAEEAYLTKMKMLKQGLMHDLLTGKVRVK